MQTRSSPRPADCNQQFRERLNNDSALTSMACAWRIEIADISKEINIEDRCRVAFTS